MPARDKLNSSVTLIWLCLLHRFYLFGHTHFLPQTGNGRSIWWLSSDSKPSNSASYLAVPHSSLSPSSLLFGFSTITSPSIAGFLLFQPSGGECVEQGNRDGGWRREREWPIEKKTDSGHGSTEDLSVNQPHFLLRDPPLPLSVKSYWICCHTLSLQTTPTMYLTVQYCAKLASHDYFVLYSWCYWFNLSLICLHNRGAGLINVFLLGLF